MIKYILGLLLISSAGVFGQTLGVITNLTAGHSVGKSITLKWADNSSGEDGYTVEASYKEKNYQSPWITVTNIPPNTISVILKPDIHKATWSYKVRACKGHFCAPDSNIVSIRSR